MEILIYRGTRASLEDDLDTSVLLLGVAVDRCITDSLRVPVQTTILVGSVQNGGLLLSLHLEKLLALLLASLGGFGTGRRGRWLFHGNNGLCFSRLRLCEWTFRDSAALRRLWCRRFRLLKREQI